MVLDSNWIQIGSRLDPVWIQIGSKMDPDWIHWIEKKYRLDWIGLDPAKDDPRSPLGPSPSNRYTNVDTPENIPTCNQSVTKKGSELDTNDHIHYDSTRAKNQCGVASRPPNDFLVT